MTTLFVSDLHLDVARPALLDLFLRFLRDEAVGADALYILGDLFEYWVGDDDPQPAGAAVADALAELTRGGVPTFFLRGNRDFLLGAEYARRCGMRILPDPCVINLYGKPTLLMHGDALCTGDVVYQQFRRQSREPAWQAAMLAQPLAARIAFAQAARAKSIEHQKAVRPNDSNAGPREDITDVAQATVESTLVRFGIATLIHGHTHRPAIHQFAVGGIPRTRVVLGDWYEQGSVLRVDADGMALSALTP